MGKATPRQLAPERGAVPLVRVMKKRSYRSMKCRRPSAYQRQPTYSFKARRMEHGAMWELISTNLQLIDGRVDMRPRTERRMVS